MALCDMDAPHFLLVEGKLGLHGFPGGGFRQVLQPALGPDAGLAIHVRLHGTAPFSANIVAHT